MSITQGSIDELVEWAQSNGAVISESVRFGLTDYAQIGAFFKKSQPQPDPKLIRIPCLIAIGMINAEELFDNAVWTDQVKNLDSNLLLKLYLAREATEERNSLSKFKHYIDLLRAVSPVQSPYFWTAQDKARLKGTNLGSSLKENMSLLVEEWWSAISLVPQEIMPGWKHALNQKFYYEYKFHTDDDLYDYLVTRYDRDNWTCFSNYLWALLILKLRSFPAYLLKDSAQFADREIKQDECILLPLIDLLNHSPTARVEWGVSDDGFFEYNSELPSDGELFNNYGRKGNEELLLAYGFCLEKNDADTAALKLKLDELLILQLLAQGVKFPRLGDYTTSVVNRGGSDGEARASDFADGIVFFLTAQRVPQELIKVFQYLVKTEWESFSEEPTLRMKFAGLNRLRQAIEAKQSILPDTSSLDPKSPHSVNIDRYVSGQRRIFQAAIKHLKHIEKDMLADPANKPKLILLKTVFKRDIKFLQSLLVSLGVTSYEHLIESQFQDQSWLLWLMRCYNRDEYKDDPEAFLPEWIQTMFKRLQKETHIDPAEIVQYQLLYQTLIPPISTAVPEIYGRGSWTVADMIIAGRLLDRISFVRGKDADSILVQQ